MTGPCGGEDEDEVDDGPGCEYDRMVQPDDVFVSFCCRKGWMDFTESSAAMVVDVFSSRSDRAFGMTTANEMDGSLDLAPRDM
jgi:hypothetical protein